MNELTKKENNLPSTITELSRFVLIGREKLISVRAEIRAIDKLQLAGEVREQKKTEAQDLAGALLDAEVRIGELLKTIPKDNPEKQRIPSGGKSLKTTKLGFDKHQVSSFQQMAEHQDIVGNIKQLAIEKDELPTRTAVLNEIKKIQRESRIKESIKKAEKGDGFIEILSTKKKFRILYADPAWQYRDKMVEKYGSAEHHYRTMSIEELCKLPIKQIAEKDAVLFLWVTSPILEECFEVIKAWNFKYKASFIWDKVKPNYGHYNSVRHELLLICIKGNCIPDSKKQIDSVISIERTKGHSEKPKCFYEIIEQLYTYGNKIELFARKKREGWFVWGNEI